MERADIVGTVNDANLTDHTARLGPGHVVASFADGIADRHRGACRSGGERGDRAVAVRAPLPGGSGT